VIYVYADTRDICVCVVRANVSARARARVSHGEINLSDNNSLITILAFIGPLDKKERYARVGRL